MANVPILYPLKTPEKQSFYDDFWGYKMGTLARNRLRCFFGIEGLPVQTSLVAQPGLGTQPCYEAPGDFQFKIRIEYSDKH